MSIILTAAAMAAAAPAPTPAAQPAVDPGSHAQQQAPADTTKKGCCCEKMGKDGGDCCAKMGKDKGGEHAGHGAH